MNLITLHLLSLFITLPVIIYADHIGFQYFTGRTQTVNSRKIKITHLLVTIGVLFLVVTGVAVTIPAWEVFLTKPMFYAKIAFVATLFVNGIFIGNLMEKAVHTPYANLSLDKKRILIMSGAISAICWLATIAIGFWGI